jgi:endonuclease III
MPDALRELGCHHSQSVCRKDDDVLGRINDDDNDDDDDDDIERTINNNCRQLMFMDRPYKPMVMDVHYNCKSDVPSPFGLLEELFSDNPWRLLMCTIFLNRTQRKQVDSTLHEFLQRWPALEYVLTYAKEDESLSKIKETISPMGMTNKRAHGIVQFCKEFLSLLETKQDETGTPDRTVVTTSCGTCTGLHPVAYSLTRKELIGLHFCGDYAADGYQIFIQGDVMSPVKSNDHALLAYVHWKRSSSITKKQSSVQYR